MSQESSYIRWSEQERVLADFVSRKVNYLQDGHLAKKPIAVRRLAELRRAIPLSPGVVPEVWSTELMDLPSHLVGKGEAPSEAEAAVHTALTLYALHQQSKTMPMHVDRGYSLGSAVRVLLYRSEKEQNDTNEPPQRFRALITADTFSEVAHYSRQLIQQLKAAGVPIDYASFAVDLLRLQNPWRADWVRRQWGRDFVAQQNPATE